MHPGGLWKWIVAIPLFVVSAAANAAQWHVVQSSGEVWLGSSAAQQVALKRAAEVPDSGIVITGKTGRITLARGADTMVIGPNSVISVPADRHGKTTVLEKIGEAAFTVDRRTVPHFTVETPYLVAVVKGTRFTVQVSSAGADVILDRGSVGVTALASGERIDIAPGQYAIVKRNGGHLTTGGMGSLNKTEQGKPRSPVVVPLSSGQLWDLAAGQLNRLALRLVALGKTPNGVGLAVGPGGSNSGGTGSDNTGASGTGTASAGSDAGSNISVSVGGIGNGGISVSVGGISLGLLK